MNPQPNPHLIVTLDGPAGTGKSAVAHLLSQCLNLQFLDTGAMYRAVAATVIDQNIDPTDHKAVAVAAQSITINFDWNQTPPSLLINDQDASKRIRDADVTALTPQIASIPAVRQSLVQAQRLIGKLHPRLVTEGRDQGSVVFTDATVKFYLDADPAIRAQRRADQLRQNGHEADEKLILQQIITRDQQDMNRADSPLKCPQDAITVDTSHMTLQEVVNHLADTVNTTIQRGN